MNDKMTQLKNLLKEKATEIRNMKNETKEYQRKHGGSCGGRQWTLKVMSRNYRMHHIAYSMLRGRAMNQIEQPHNLDSNKLPISVSQVNEIKEEYYEDVCVSAE